ncbi:toprim domain-containing protein [Pseudomonas massiliensis]|uniref:toprim domain-containing protein n=1 Tax=Pseudomonas massiliensis TaxID=522492 RepID=UPI000B133A3C|nr:toprim domain-containing protein [Pseudomonas massiliensis]
MEIKNGAIAPTGSACLNNAELVFLQVLQQNFGLLSFVPVADGELHRFRVPEDRPGSRNGWYVLHADGLAAGAFGSWKTGESRTWSSREPADACEAKAMREQIAQAVAKRDAERRRRQLAAAEYAARLWRDARRADPAHPYLVRKRIRPYSLRQRGAELLIPLYADGELVNLQRIRPDGSKRFLFGGRIRGTYSPLGNINGKKPLLVCEGWATGATLMDLGYTVACAMNAGNLKAAAVALRARYPGVVMIVAGDDDRLTDGNPGRAAAEDAAHAASALVAFPDWPDDCPASLTDFNDLHVWRAAQ